MEQVNVWKCSFCKKTSFHKGTVNKHKRKCFYNPATRSCATCLWFSPLLLGSGYPPNCFKNVFPADSNNTYSKVKLKTQCDQWIDVAVIEDIDILDEQNKKVLTLLLEGKEELLQVIEELNSNQFHELGYDRCRKFF